MWRAPIGKVIRICTSLYLFAQIELINPALIMLLGSVATRQLLGVRSVNEVRGRVIEHNNRTYLAGYHPASSFYREDMAEHIRHDFALLRQELQKLAAHSDTH